MSLQNSEKLTPEAISQAIEAIEDPERQLSLKALSAIGEVAVLPGKVGVEIKLPTPSWLGRAAIEAAIQAKLAPLIGARELVIDVLAEVGSSRALDADALLPSVKNLVLFSSAKGGVGKSTVAINVAAALAQDGARVGLLDADLYGPSIPTMVGTHEKPKVMGQKMLPITRFNMRLMSIGFIVNPEDALSWRGPMLGGALMQFVRDVEWGELDYLILDLPPGTGDVQLTIAQNLKVSGAVIVSTPQTVALADVRRGQAMFEKIGVSTLGVVENMAYFVCTNCQEKHYIFAAGGGHNFADQLKVPLLGEVPLEISARAAADAGTPAVLDLPDSASSKAFVGIARRLATDLAKKAEATRQKPAGLKIIQ